jgi:hypothetical protein
MPRTRERGVQAVFGVLALTFGVLTGAVSVVSAVGWVASLPEVFVDDWAAGSRLIALVMIAGFGSVSVLLLRAARRLLR